MIRAATTRAKRRVCEELTLPSPARIALLTEEIQRGWTPAKRARRAGQARRVQIAVVRTLDLAATEPEQI